MDRFVVILALLLISGLLLANGKSNLQLNIVHINDFHARFDEMNVLSGACHAEGKVLEQNNLYFCQVDEKQFALFYSW